ncbi:MAG: Gfo/Idh/MocA family oxidoreductase [Planctomycetota bacterium]
MADAGSFRLGIVGAGGIAGAHAGAAKGTGGRLSVAAAVDTSAPTLEKFTGEHGCRGFAGVDALFGAIDAGEIAIDGLVLCTPPTARVETLRGAMERGIAVLSEKPLAATVEDGQDMAQLVGKHPDVCSGVGYCHRFAPAVIEMKKLASAGKIGRVTRFENTFAFNHPTVKDKWMSDPAVAGGGSFIDTGSHSLDLFQFLVGTPEVVGAAFDHEWEGRAESSASVVVRAGSAGGASGVILAGWTEPERFDVRLVGTHGSLSYDYFEPEKLHFRGVDGSSEQIGVQTHEVRFAEQLLAFADAARKPGDRAARRDLATFEDALRVTRAVDAAARASRII